MAQTSMLLNEIRSFLEEELHLHVPSDDVDLVVTGILDSMAFVDLLTHLEKRYQILIAPEMLEIENFKSVLQIATFVEEQLRRQ